MISRVWTIGHTTRKLSYETESDSVQRELGDWVGRDSNSQPTP